MSKKFPVVFLPIRLLFLIVMQCVPGAFVLLAGIVCSNWVQVNMGTSGRTYNNPGGNENYRSVRESNCMLSRLWRIYIYIYSSNLTPSWVHTWKPKKQAFEMLQ